MSIPAVITESFKAFASHSDYEDPILVKRADANDSLRVCTTLMSDMLGRAQVIFPGDRLLDLDALNNAMGRELRLVKQKDQQVLLDQYALSALPAIPNITGIPTIFDQSLTEIKDTYAYVDIGDPQNLVRVKRAILFEMTSGKAQQGAFTRKITDIPKHDQADNDKKELTKALEKFTTLRIKQRIEDTLELPPLPQSAREIIQLRASPDASAEDLSNIVEKDPSLAAQVVSWASSSFYNAPGSIKSVHDAIIRVLGFDLVMNLSMGLSMGRTLNLPSEEPEGYLPYWQKSLWMALGTTVLISKIEPAYRPSYGMAYLSGLLHNFGYLVLAHVFPPHHELICRYREANPHIDPSIIEAHCLDLTSEQIGSMLMHVWSLPEEVVTAIRHQKNAAFDEDHCQYAKILHLTQYLLGKNGVIPQTIDEPPIAHLAYFNLTEASADEALKPLIDAPEEVIGMSGMMKA